MKSKAVLCIIFMSIAMMPHTLFGQRLGISAGLTSWQLYSRDTKGSADECIISSKPSISVGTWIKWKKRVIQLNYEHLRSDAYISRRSHGGYTDMDVEARVHRFSLLLPIEVPLSRFMFSIGPELSLNVDGGSKHMLKGFKRPNIHTEEYKEGMDMKVGIGLHGGVGANLQLGSMHIRPQYSMRVGLGNELSLWSASLNGITHRFSVLYFFKQRKHTHGVQL